jgi:hypothetical protein
MVITPCEISGYASPLLLAIIAHSLAKGKLFFPRSKDSLLRRDVRRRGLALWSDS